ncbi:thiazole biosynthesis protein ThiF [Brevibacillus panacihumi W25]|uniref:Thiazole biosynthesis protein ThiF n=1 Tax=Brevibacillus panacihumi W25 TaxID=1408254 RepID=V6MAZ8_9BACL|nr:ThiF family adenylyltransferase [Brevibacillus panacihumi]EST55746.1 thiazole biosynthesis protein ThiF [Brevibacillus panacihumi W25]
MIDLQLNKQFKKIFFYIVQLGAGGNGGYILQQCAQMMNIFHAKGMYVVADPDVVEEKNLANQLFISKDVGLKKASVLAKRYRSHYNLPIAAYDERYIEDVQSLHRLFQHTDYTGCYRWDTFMLPVLIGAVDNNFTRQVMNDYFLSQDNLLYIDVGVESAWVPQDQRPPSEWSEHEKKRHNQTGWTGQVVAGLRLDGKTVLDPVAERFPDILLDQDEIAPSEMACSNVVSSEPQRLITNRLAAQAVAGYLSEIFGDKTISNHVTFFHAKKQYMRAERVNL